MERQQGNRYTPAEQTYEQLNQGNKNFLSKTAMGLFMKASREIPSSITAQGALIARYCKESGLPDPLLLSTCLRLDDLRIAKIAEIAAKVHEHVGNGPVPISHTHISGVIKTDFTYADIFMDFETEELDFITHNLYAEIKRLNLNETVYYYRALDVRREIRMHATREEIKERTSRLFRKRKTKTHLVSK